MHKRPLFGDIKVIYKFLKAKLKLKHPVKLTFSGRMLDAGTCTFDPTKKIFHIRINKELSNDAAIFTLLHEISHQISWFSPEWLEGGDHNYLWGTAYSRVYNTFLEYLET